MKIECTYLICLSDPLNKVGQVKSFISSQLIFNETCQKEICSLIILEQLEKK